MIIKVLQLLVQRVKTLAIAFNLSKFLNTSRLRFAMPFSSEVLSKYLYYTTNLLIFYKKLL